MGKVRESEGVVGAWASAVDGRESTWATAADEAAWLEAVLVSDADELLKRALLALYPLLRSGAAQLLERDGEQVIVVRTGR